MEDEPVPNPARVTDAVHRLKGMFLEDPGTRLSLEDASRLTGVERSTCSAILDALQDAHFLSRGHDGLFSRRSE
jgi:DNA-binding IclR family transcriptional regulator